MNNVKSKDIVGSYACMLDDLPVNNRMKVLDALSEFDRPVRPYELNKIDLKPETISVYLNYWHDRGRVNRILKDGLIWWEFIK